MDADVVLEMPRKEDDSASYAGLSLTSNDFKWIDESHLPMLVLGVKAYVHDKKFDFHFTFKDERYWKPICHQTAGIACHHHYLIGRLLRPKSMQIERKMRILNDKWLDSNTGSFGVSLNEVNKYRHDLIKLFKVDCERCYGDFEEGIAPIDVEYVKIMTGEDLPEDLDDMLVFKNSFEKAIGSIGRWQLWILMENCD